MIALASYYYLIMQENQLLKDRKKNLRKRLSPGENNCSTAPITVSNPVRPSSHDSRAVKLVLVDCQNMQKVGPGKGSLVKRNVNLGTDRTNSKVDSSSLKTAKHRRKTGDIQVKYRLPRFNYYYCFCLYLFFGIVFAF